MLLQALCVISKPLMNSNWSYSPETLNSGQNRRLFVPCDLEIWQMTFKNNMAPLLGYFKICVSFQSHQTIQTGVIVRKRSMRVKISDFFYPCDIGIWRMTLKNNRAPLPYYFKLRASVQSHRLIQTGVTVRKRSIRVKIGDYLSCVTLEFDRWPLNNRAPLLCYFKLCASFQSHRSIQTGVAVRKRSIRVKIGDFFVPCDLGIWRMTLKKHQGLCIILSPYVNINWSYGPENLNWVLISVTLTFDLWPVTLAFCMDITFVIGNNSWKFHDDTMMGT